MADHTPRTSEDVRLRPQAGDTYTFQLAPDVVDVVTAVDAEGVTCDTLFNGVVRSTHTYALEDWGRGFDFGYAATAPSSPSATGGAS